MSLSNIEGLSRLVLAIMYTRWECIKNFRDGILNRTRACIWERFRRADALCIAFRTDVEGRFPEGGRPGLTAIQKRDQILTPSGELDLRPLRLALIAKLQRLVPELCDPTHVTLANDSGHVLWKVMNQLDERACGLGYYDYALFGERMRDRRAADVESGDAIHIPDRESEDADDEGEEEEGEDDEEEDEPMD